MGVGFPALVPVGFPSEERLGSSENRGKLLAVEWGWRGLFLREALYLAAIAG